MAGVEGLALYIGGVLAPDCFHLVGLLHDATPAPKGKEWAIHLSALIAVFIVVVEVDGGPGPVVLAARVDRVGVEAAFVFGESFGCEGL